MSNFSFRILSNSWFKILLLLFFTACNTQSGDQTYVEAKNLYSEEDYEGSRVLFKKAIKMGLEEYAETEAYTYLGNTYSELGQYDSGKIMYDQALEIDSSYVDAWVNMGIDYRKQGDYEEANKCYQLAMIYDPRDPELYVSLGVLNIFQGKVEDAVKNLEFAIELNPQIPTAHANYALALAMSGEFVRAEYEIKTAVAQGYQNGEVIKNRIEELKKLE